MALEVRPSLPTHRRHHRAEPDSDDAALTQKPEEPESKRAPRKRSKQPAPRKQLQGRPAYTGESLSSSKVSLIPELWERLLASAAEASQRGVSTSASRLLMAIVHFHMPQDLDTQRALARGWPATYRARYRGQRSEQVSVRMYPSLLERLGQEARAVEQAERIRHALPRLLNALVDASAPGSAAETEELADRFDLACEGELGDL